MFKTIDPDCKPGFLQMTKDVMDKIKNLNVESILSKMNVLHD